MACLGVFLKKGEKYYHDGFSATQRYYRRNAEKVKANRRNSYQKNWSKERIVLYQWRKDNPDKVLLISRRSNENRLYGKGAFDHFEVQRGIQQGKCAVCQRKMRKACSDHNHETSQWRGILCDRCNRCLGLLHDDVNVLEAAIAYLKKWETQK